MKGKTFTLQPPSIVKEFAKILRVWLEHHPQRDNPDAPLWTHLKGARITAITGIYAEQKLKEIARRAGIKRRVHFHMFRHSAATFYAKKHVNEAELRKLFGWSPRSRTPSTYVHLTEEDAKNASLRAHGIIPTEALKEEFATVKCVYCGEENASINKFCSFCGVPLGEEADRIVEKQRAMEKGFELLSDPKVLALLRRLKELSL